ncbi:MAG: hypothetical protein A2Y94_07275 [Caldithrix sp. RBG_13_44_9]|nr:MAG: hypothetical protein A2Y94_07275 [Caldithrix sp. RBG_13_44_9]
MSLFKPSQVAFTSIFLLTFFYITPAEDNGSVLRIGIIGDQTGSYQLDESYRILETAVAKLSRLEPDIVLHVGDMVESSSGIKDYQQYQANFERAVRIMNQFPVPWYLTAGDHDVVPPVFKSASADHSRLKWFQELCTSAGFPMHDHLYYSFDFKGYHFISLFSLENLHTDPRWGPIFLNKFSQEQIDWLKQDLETYQDGKGIVVFLHQPNWYVWSNWFEIHQILRQYPVAGVIAGHYHYDQDDGLIDQIHYLVIGSTGGAVKQADIHSGGSPQYALLTLENRCFTDIQLFEAETDSLLELTPRRSMDRVQALSCMLDNLYMDERIYSKDGHLISQVSECAYDSLRFIGLESLANPIDLPITISISSLNSFLINPRWADTSQTKLANNTITLQPGERIGWSNYTNVGNWQKPEPLWLIEVVDNPSVWREQQQISFQVRVSFTDIRDRWIESTVNYPIQQMP